MIIDLVRLRDPLTCGKHTTHTTFIFVLRHFNAFGLNSAPLTSRVTLDEHIFQNNKAKCDILRKGRNLQARFK